MTLELEPLITGGVPSLAGASLSMCLEAGPNYCRKHRFFNFPRLYPITGDSLLADCVSKTLSLYMGTGGNCGGPSEGYQM